MRLCSREPCAGGQSLEARVTQPLFPLATDLEDRMIVLVARQESLLDHEGQS